MNGFLFTRSLLALIAAVTMITATSAGCDLFGEDDDRALVGTTWRLEAFLSDAAFPPSDDPLCALDGVDCANNDRSYTATFQADGEIDVQADCNMCGGTFERDAGALSISELVCTEIACGRGSRGTAFAAALTEAERYRTRDGLLLIAYGEGRGLLLQATSPRSDASSRSR
jgi:heat shock protein HslJ